MLITIHYNKEHNKGTFPYLHDWRAIILAFHLLFFKDWKNKLENKVKIDHHWALDHELLLLMLTSNYYWAPIIANHHWFLLTTTKFMIEYIYICELTSIREWEMCMECKSLGNAIVAIATFTTFVIQQKIYKMFQFHV
jgi:hypothetical protein